MKLSFFLVNIFNVLVIISSTNYLRFLGYDSNPTVGDTVISCGAYQDDACNCVYYARDRQPKLPSGLSTCDDKKNHVNSNTAAAGCVMFRTGDPTYCHAAYVTKVSGSTIYIEQVFFFFF